MAINRRALAAAFTAALALTTLTAFTSDKQLEGGIDECSVNEDDTPKGLNPLADDMVKWVPDVGHPVFWGYQDVGAAQGAPGDIRIYYPSLDGTPQNARIAKQCSTPYPVVLFLHGQPPAGDSSPLYHQEFHRIGRDLAKSGYIVVAPGRRAGVPDGANAQAMVDEAMEDLAWVRTQWSNKKWVDPLIESTAVAGHSYGALLAARVAAAYPQLRAFVSFSGPYTHLNDPVQALEAVKMPSFFAWANGTGQNLIYEDLDGNPPLWDLFAQSKYGAVFKGEHFDYIDDTRMSPAGPCHPLIGGALADLATLFVAMHLPVPFGGTEVPLDLTKPQVSLTFEQEFYAGSHLKAVELIEGQDGCRVDLRWDVDGDAGDRVIGQ
jgi:pimeloyl-ACP methyl ester carboxylesterase